MHGSRHSKAYGAMTQELKDKYDATVKQLASLGISGMMHGYLPFDDNDDLLVPFRTWRNNNANKAAEILREDFQVNILNVGVSHNFINLHWIEAHVEKVRYMTTLAGYIHWYLTDEKVLGIGDASGMFPIDSETQDYRDDIIQRFNKKFSEKGYTQDVRDILPKVVVAGSMPDVLLKQVRN